MKKFKTITEFELIKAAYSHILDLYIKETERNDRFQKEHGRDSIICAKWMDTYSKQLDELHEAILKLEQSENK